MNQARDDSGNDVDVEALLTAIDKISESEERLADADDPHKVHTGAHATGRCRELAQAYELDIHDVSVSEINR